MHIENFNDLLSAARAQPLPQRLLFVFAGVELPDGASAEQRAAFDAGHGGALVPLMCVDKSPEELPSFEALVAEAEQFGRRWALVFSAAMSSTRQQAPTTTDADLPLQAMVEAIKRGDIAAYLPFDRQGLPLQLG
ncbi:MAG: ribonucleotide reductase subunit alpha [Rhodoferax sp.]|nr:ribonucleotide reductase subunit alpha [Rhodoferax sp.]